MFLPRDLKKKTKIDQHRELSAQRSESSERAVETNRFHWSASSPLLKKACNSDSDDKINVKTPLPLENVQFV